MSQDLEKGLDSLVVWKNAVDLAIWICKDILPKFPTEEKYALSSQLRRSCQSISANIAEGYGRFHFQDSIQFCYIARGSLEETYTQLLIAARLQYLSDAQFRDAQKRIQDLRRSLNGYILFLKQSKRGNNEAGFQVRESGPDYWLDPNEIQDEISDGPTV